MKPNMQTILKKSLMLLAALSIATSGQAQINRPNLEPDLSGKWDQMIHEDWQEQGTGPDLVDYLGLPLTDEARARGLSYDAASISMPARQCLFYAPHYLLRGPFGLAIWHDIDPTTGKVNAWHFGAVLDLGIHTIWMDGREPPSALAPRYVGGLGFGEWIGNTLRAEFPLMHEGLLRRNGVPLSDQTSMTMYFTRNDDILTVIGEIIDPVYMTEPFVLSRVFRLDGNIPRHTGELCTPLVELPRLDGSGMVAHYLPGQNLFLREFSESHGIPLETVLGGAETMYPEHREVFEEAYQRPEACIFHCCMAAGNNEVPEGCQAAF